MDIQKTPVKYSMNIWKTLPNYPTKIDVLYEVYSHLFKNGKAEFSEQTLNSIWFDQTGSGSWKGTKTEFLVKELITDGTFKEQKNINDKIWYTIEEKLNPFK